MARPTKIDYLSIIADYKTGQYSIQELAKRYKVNRTSLHSYFKRNGVEVCNNLQQSINALDRGLELLNQEKEGAICNSLTQKEREQNLKAIESGIEYLHQKHGELARLAMMIAGKSLKKAELLLDSCSSGDEFNLITSGFKNVVSATNLFPKAPQNQINIQNNNNNNNANINNNGASEEKSKITIEMELVGECTRPDPLKDEVIEVEAIENKA